MRWRGRSPAAGQPSCTPHPGIPGIAALGTCHPARAEDGDGLLVAGADARDRPGRDRARGAARRGSRRPAARRRDLGVRAERGGRADRGVEELREGDPRGSRASRPRGRSPTPAVPCVVKADGLAAGKGVFVCRTQEELDAALAAAAALGGPLVVEELLEGEELSVFALCDGERAIPLGAARDYKRAGDGDTGPNTGGMGAFSPVPGFERGRGRGARRADPPAGARGARPAGLAVRRRALRRPDADRRRAAGARVQLPVRRPGDAVAPPAARGRPARRARRRRGRRPRAAPSSASAPRAAVTVVVAGGDYPERGDTGSPIDGIEAAEAPARSSSTPAPRGTASSSSRTAAGSSA